MILGTQGASLTRDGQKVTVCGFSEFRLLDRFLRGEDITPIFADRKAVLSEVQTIAAKTGDGAWLLPVLRVFGMMENICQLHPQEYADYYTSVRALIDFAGQHGFVTLFEAFPDSQLVMPNPDDRERHWWSLLDVWQGCPFVLPSLNNENPKNGSLDWTRFARPVGHVATVGSNLSDEPPSKPGWDFSCFHGRRDGIKGLMASTDLGFYVLSTSDRDSTGPDIGWGLHHPVIHDEPLGCADAYIPEHGRTNDPRAFYRIAQDAAAWGAGSVFHSDCGVQSVPFTDRQRACAEAFVMGCAKVDPVQRYDPMWVI